MPLVQLPAPGQPYVAVTRDGDRGVLDIDPATITDLYKAHGALLFRDFDIDVAQFRGLAQQFCSTSVVNESPGRRPIDPESHVFTVDAGTHAFPLHPELSREPWKPDVAFFGCLSAPKEDGKTTICDGIALAQALPAQLRNALVNRRLLYIQSTWPALLEFWLGTATPTDAQLANPPPGCPYQFRRFPQGIARIFSRPALHKPMFADALAFGNFLLFARALGRSDSVVLDDGRPVPEQWLQVIGAIADRLTVPIDWQAGDLLMLDNTRFMHGRTEIRNPEERLILSYFGYLGFAVPDREEPPNAIWRRENFEPPVRSDGARRRQTA
ncbi:MAG TPA: TauD/TfdA family dioxygenase [Sphingomicrobium sp.]|nr:TauD/TfdA family dioxygenase [Sphingomicrobium sp.]